MASATQRTYHDITVGGGTWISEVRWSLHCYTSASTSGCTTGCEAPITYSYTTAGSPPFWNSTLACMSPTFLRAFTNSEQ